MGTLYVVATPIGNLEDITARALRVLREVNLVAAEDTRRSRRLLTHFGISVPLVSYQQYDEPERRQRVLSALSAGDVALVSDAGTPGLSDPGLELVAAAVEQGYSVVPVPGPSAALAALVVSGLPAVPFIFAGFLPRRGAERRRALQGWSDRPETLVLYEAPHRLLGLLEDLLQVLGDRRVAVARELTKLHEEVRRETLTQALTHFRATSPRGEFTLVVAGAPAAPAAPVEADTVRALLERALRAGSSPRDAAREVARATGLPRREVYRLLGSEPKF